MFQSKKTKYKSSVKNKTPFWFRLIEDKSVADEEIIEAIESDVLYKKISIDKAMHDVGWTVLARAAFCGRLDLVKFLVEGLGADINLKTKKGRVFHKLWVYNISSLLCAAQKGHLNIVRYFLKKGVDVNEGSGPHDTTPMHIAARENQVEVLRHLLIQKALHRYRKTKDKDRLGSTPLMIAVRDDSFDAAKMLISYFGTNVLYHIDAMGRRPKDFLGLKCKKNKLEWKNFFKKIYSISRKIPNEKSAPGDFNFDELQFYLVHAATRGRLDLIKHCLRLGAKTNKPDPNGFYALHQALYFKQARALKYLIDQGSDVEVNQNDLTPILVALLYSEVDMAKLLFMSGAKFPESYKGESILFLLVKSNCMELVRFGLKQVKNKKQLRHVISQSGETPLISAVQQDSVQMANFLFECESIVFDVNHKLPDGRTALQIAISKNQLKMTELLVAKGALYSQEDVDYALRREFFHLARILLKAQLVRESKGRFSFDKHGLFSSEPAEIEMKNIPFLKPGKFGLYDLSVKF